MSVNCMKFGVVAKRRSYLLLSTTARQYGIAEIVLQTILESGFHPGRINECCTLVIKSNDITLSDSGFVPGLLQVFF